MAFWTWPTSFPTKNQPSVQTIRPTLRCSRCSSPELSVNAPSQKDTSGPAEGIPGCGTGENPRSWAVPEEKLWWYEYIHFEQLHSQIGFCCAVFFTEQIGQEKWNSLGSFSAFSVFVRFEPMVLEVSKVSWKILGVFRNKWMWVKSWDQGSTKIMFLRLGIQRGKPSLTTQIPALVYQGNHVILGKKPSYPVYCVLQSNYQSLWGSKTGKEIPTRDSMTGNERVSLKHLMWLGCKHKDIG